MTKYILLSAEATGSKSQEEELKFQCTECSEIKLSHQLGKHAYYRHGSRVISADTRGIYYTRKEDLLPMDYQDMVREFHETYGAPVASAPRPLPKRRKKLRLGLIKEELKELRVALKANDPVATYDACLDLLYVIFGLLVETGMDARPGFEEVHRSNMSKLGADGKPIVSRGEELDGYPAGKILKGPNYFAPDLAKVLDNQRLEKIALGAPRNGDPVGTTRMLFDEAPTINIVRQDNDLKSIGTRIHQEALRGIIR